MRRHTDPDGRCDTPAWANERDREIQVDYRGIIIKSDGVRAWMPGANGFDQRSGNLRCRLEDRGDLGMSLTEQRDMGEACVRAQGPASGKPTPRDFVFGAAMEREQSERTYRCGRSRMHACAGHGALVLKRSGICITWLSLCCIVRRDN